MYERFLTLRQLAFLKNHNENHNMQKSIYEITQDELDFLYAHVAKLKTTLANQVNKITILESQIQTLQNDKKDRK